MFKTLGISLNLGVMSQSTFHIFKEKDTGSLAHVLNSDAYLEEYQETKGGWDFRTLAATLPYTALALKSTKLFLLAPGIALKE